MTIHSKMFDNKTITSGHTSISVGILPDETVSVSFSTQNTSSPVTLNLSISDAIDLECMLRDAINEAGRRERSKVSKIPKERSQTQMYDVFSVKAPNDPVDW
jgi:hypothetical protein